jgi:hypothetical protein
VALTIILRLPRNNPDVLANLTYLAKCINIMPTSGYNFTAQAPLFPVFLLGMLATVPEHVDVAQTWFESVTSTPVRSVRIAFPIALAFENANRSIL